MVRGAAKSNQPRAPRTNPNAVKAMQKRNAELKAQGIVLAGRPKGVLNAKTIAKIKSKEAFDDAVRERAGLLADDLFRNSRNGDTQAAKVLLEQTFGKAKDNSLKDNLQTAFSLLEFGRRAALLEQQAKDGNADVTAVKPLLPHPRPSSGE